MSDFFGGTPPKTSFLFGLVTGVAVSAIVGFGMVASGNVATGSSSPRVAANPSPAPAPKPTPAPVPEPSGPVDVAVTKDDHIRGNPKAKVTLVEFSDMQCPFCGRFHPTMQQAMKEYGDKVRWVYKHFPLESIHPYARPLAEASECAAEQGKFWEFADADFSRQSEISTDFAEKLAGELKLDMGKFKSCVSSRKYQQKVTDQYQQGIAAGVQGTPHTLVNGQPLSGAQPYEALKALIDQALTK